MQKLCYFCDRQKIKVVESVHGRTSKKNYCLVWNSLA